MSSAVVAGAHARRGGISLASVRRLVRRRPSLAVGGVIIAAFVVLAIGAPFVAPYSPVAQDLSRIRPGFVPGPSAQHLLGLDTLGRDEFSRLVFGARQSLLVAVLSVAGGGTAGVLIGGLAAAGPSLADNVLMRLVDTMMAVPGLLFAIGIAAALGPSLHSVIIAVGVANIPVFARLTRSAMLVEREREYVLAARSIGVRPVTVILRHILPNSLSGVVVQATLSLASAIIDAAGLSYLGLGSGDPSVPEWGRMLADAQSALNYAPWLVLAPGLAIALAALGFTLIGEDVRARVEAG